MLTLAACATTFVEGIHCGSAIISTKSAQGQQEGCYILYAGSIICDSIDTMNVHVECG
jgi:hypothetical protein